MSELRITAADRLARQAHVTETLGLMRNLGQALNTNTRTGERPTVAEVLGQVVAKGMVDKAIESRPGFMKTYRDPVSNNTFRFADDSERKAGVRQLLAREKARVVLANGLTVAENIADVDTWHRLMFDEEFINFGKKPIRQERLPTLLVPQPSQVIEAITRTGGNSERYLGQMAAKWWDVYDNRPSEDMPMEATDLSVRMLQKLRLYYLQNSTKDFRLRDLAGEFSFNKTTPEIFFAASFQRSTDEAYALPEKMADILSALTRRKVKSGMGWYFEGFSKHTMEVLRREGENSVVQPDVCLKTSYVLLNKVLRFAGTAFPDAEKIADDIKPSSTKISKKMLTEQTDKILALANQPGISGYMSQCLPVEDGRPATKPNSNVSSAYDGVDRILIAVNNKVRFSGASDEDMQGAVAAASDCIRILLKHGEQLELEQELKRVA